MLLSEEKLTPWVLSCLVSIWLIILQQGKQLCLPMLQGNWRESFKRCDLDTAFILINSNSIWRWCSQSTSETWAELGFGWIPNEWCTPTLTKHHSASLPPILHHLSCPPSQKSRWKWSTGVMLSESTWILVKSTYDWSHWYNTILP